MKILVAGTSPIERERLLALLSDHYPCVGLDDNESLAAAFERHAPTMVLLSPDEIAIIAGRAYSIALVAESPSPAEFSHALAAGADDVLRTNACKEEVWARVGNLARMRPHTTPMPTLRMRIGEVRIWKDIERIVATELGELLGTSLDLSSSLPTDSAAPAPARTLVHTSVIPLTLVSGHVLVQLGIGVDEATRAQLVETLLGGDDSGEALRDALREMANTAGGAIRRAALDDGVSFSIGLPSNENLFGASSQQRMWTISNGCGLQLDCTVTLSANKPTRIRAADLREGMVLARDVLAHDGTTIAAGTSITRTTAEQIGQHARDREIEVEAIATVTSRAM